VSDRLQVPAGARYMRGCAIPAVLEEFAKRP
jgi:hypothetical protein